MSFVEQDSYQDDLNDIKPVWGWAMNWFNRPPNSLERRAKQVELVERFKSHIGNINSIPELHDYYRGNTLWAVHIAKELYPTEFYLLGIHGTTATAFGLRYVELFTGQALSARQPLPKWIVEFTVWQPQV